MENEDIIQSPDDSVNQSIQEQVLDTPSFTTQNLTSSEIISPDDSIIQSVEETQPYLTQQNFLEFEEVSFVTNNTLGAQDFLLFSYGKITFNKIVEFDGNYVIKFNAKVLKNGEDILINYIDLELEKKYKNKQKK